MARDYVTSIGVSTRWGLKRHRYYDTRRRYSQRWFSVLGFTVVIASYRRSRMRFPP